jgi:ATP adenylyltransferase
MSTFPKQELETLWAPWRVEYYERKGVSMNFLEEAAQSTDDPKSLVVTRRKHTFLIMNAYPYAAGHLMAVPYAKVARTEDLSPEAKLELWELAELAQRILRKVVSAQGFNLGLNLGTCAGAGVADHLHLHIVPRWEGDHNFMTVIPPGHPRLIPEGLETMYQKLSEAARSESV